MTASAILTRTLVAPPTRCTGSWACSCMSGTLFGRSGGVDGGCDGVVAGAGVYELIGASLGACSTTFTGGGGGEGSCARVSIRACITGTIMKGLSIMSMRHTTPIHWCRMNSLVPLILPEPETCSSTVLSSTVESSTVDAMNGTGKTNGRQI